MFAHGLPLRFRIVQQRGFFVQFAVSSPAFCRRLRPVLVQHPQRSFDPSVPHRHSGLLRTPWDDQECPSAATVRYRRNQLLRVAAGSLRDPTWQRAGQPTHRWVETIIIIKIYLCRTFSYTRCSSKGFHNMAHVTNENREEDMETFKGTQV